MYLSILELSNKLELCQLLKIIIKFIESYFDVDAPIACELVFSPISPVGLGSKPIKSWCEPHLGINLDYYGI